MKLTLLAHLVTVTHAVTCTDLRAIYSQSSCCETHDNVQCLQEIPDCAQAGPGHVCLQNNTIVVKGLLEAFGLGGNHIVLKQSLIPDTNNQYDLGNAEFKIRDIYEQD